MNITNDTEQDVTLSLPRDSRRFCAAAPHVLILQVGTRDVVYPNCMCTMDMVTTVLKAGEVVPFTRSVTLPKGHDLIEPWVRWFTGGRLHTPYLIVEVH
ncbi:hypothetical protein [Deinococcus hohokamensis]|uniref:Uncharacterized protein n=1 Tax=Deinococcus hohokamensis TaxID=309883 RepID=A0ABV9ICX4_9DEIO